MVVYNERTNEYLDELHSGFYDKEKMINGVRRDCVAYHPWTSINPNDEFDTFVAWRDPTILKDVTARVKICDLHDTINPVLVYNAAEYVTFFLFKSQWHRSLYPKLPDDKCAVIGNGIKENYA